MDNRKNKYISEVLQITDDLMGLANDETGLEDEGGLGILLGVMRDCAYKIRRHAELEEQKAKISCVHANAVLVFLALGALSVLFASPVSATTIILSTDNTETLGGLTFDQDDLAEYNPTTGTATLYFDGILFSGPADIDAAHVLDTGNIVLSTVAGETLGGLTFGKGDLVEYDPTTDTATLFLDENLFSSSQPNIDAAYILDNGNIILSTTGNATIGGLGFGKDDLIEYNPTTDVATLFFDGNLFSGNENIDAVNLLTSGNIVLSTVGNATLGGLSFGPGDLAEYNPTTSTATLYFDGSNFASSANIDAVQVTSLPEPATIAMLGLGCLIFMRSKRR
ncbi:MAG: PEP-CTERM sorting domain-containing protein [Phycisphaerae bacterium]|nr:PEP-CTERM sorting domain-containing protein [Phycisphaerae bacterium]NIP52484.1 PEP-CTERM sorting domain-containing protein [Phycisphaerae bacterium]NIS51477.1 PEP-CTERM sorting domain-containing protein [Phycisphaerae bacterium]NIU08004.1 PEP-CTERM sorting domain-containing protein [Phycisphaerae bacterium]NIU56749.1 PEP-CTERM sorting domain-containing protein [Phycisphaerae bacterium]